MSKRAFFMESKLEVFDGVICDKCGLEIKKVQDGKSFWNPNRKAHHRNICRNCYDVLHHEREERWARWQNKHDELVAIQKNSEPEPDTKDVDTAGEG